MGKLKTESKTDRNVQNKAPFKLKSKKNVEKKVKLEKIKQIVQNSNIENPQQDDAVKKHDPSETEQTIYVGNIPSNTKKSQLKSLFSSFGKIKTIRFRTVDGKKIMKQKTRKDAEAISAYIVMNSKEAAENALQISGTEFKGKHIRVTKADKNFTDNVDRKRVIFVGNLKYSATDEKLYEIFSSCGELEYVRTIRNAKGCNGVAFVCFKKPESVTLALELNNTLLDERPIRVDRYSTNKLAKREDKKLTGPERRIKEKEKKQKNKDKSTEKSKNKKNEFHGVKTATMNNKKVSKKMKKTSTAMQILAKKIAPKSVTSSKAITSK